jgi:hypothetical protein
MNGNGIIEISPSSELSGRINVTLSSQNTTVARGSLAVSGSVADPLLSQ